MADFVVRIDDLADYAAAFATMTGSAEVALGTLVKGFVELADCWGDDEAGRAFFGGYGQPATETLMLAAQMPVQLTALTTAMAQTAQNYLGTEAANTDLGGGATTA